jgi:4-hydroxybutyrate CoA-transferase
MSMGTCADFIRQGCKDADLVIVETNTNFPFIYGSNLIHVSEVDYIVDADAENYLLQGADVDLDEENADTYRKIGGYLSELIPDEATIEVGLGRLNAASLMYLENKRDLGVHTEVYGNILMKLTERGIITNQKKSDRPGRAVFTQVVGTKELFQWLDHNQGVELNNCQEVLNPGTIFRQHRMTAINNAVEVDLMGQANAEFLKGKQYSGVGGICDFASAAAANLEGKSIVVLESMTKNGKFSKITPSFKPGTPVSLPRTAIEYVVTEQGIAKLAGKNPAQRARALIQVAHPKFRDELAFQAKELGML